MSIIAFDNATLELGGRTVLSKVNLAIEPGEFVGLLGPNGAGKTTLIRAILGLIAPASGTISVLGASAVCGNSAIGYMPQTRGAADMRWTGWDFVASAAGGRRWGLPRLSAEERADVDRVLELVDARKFAHRRLSDLSGGERQRLLLSQAVLGKPAILLLDEPLISLDPTHQRAAVELAVRLQKELNVAILFSAHELNPLLNAINRVLYVGNKSAVIGSVEDVITGPVLSRLYGSDIEVLHVGKRIFVIGGDSEIEGDAHRHDHGHSHEGHHHSHEGRHVRL